MGCGTSTQEVNNNDKETDEERRRKRGLGPKLDTEPDIDETHLPSTLPGYPPPKPPIGKKADIFQEDSFAHVDKVARETTDDKAALDFDTLLDHIFTGCATDLEKLRAIFVWLGSRRLSSIDYSTAVDGSPLKYLHMIHEERATHTFLFVTLCRKAGIPCVIVHGYGKSASYDVGDSVEKVRLLGNRWTCVYVSGSWRIVFPFWAFTAISNYSSGAFTKVETKGVAVRETEHANRGVDIAQQNEFYFLTDPEIFVYVAIAEDPKWQLLARPWTLEKFADVPHCKQYYLQNDFNITKGFKSILKTVDGKCEIELTSSDLTNLMIDYELFFNHKESDNVISPSLQLNNYVFSDRSNSRWKFVLRFPEEGIYKVNIIGGHLVETFLCAFKIVCNEAMKDCKPLPFNPGTVGYGPSIDTEKAGITALSHTTGLVKVHARQRVELNFKIIKGVQVKTELFNNDVSSTELRKYVKEKRDRDRLNVQVDMPESGGEYALKMFTFQKGEITKNNVCNYLLTSEEDKPKRKRNYENAQEKNTRRDLQNVTNTSGTIDIEELQKLIAKFEQLALEDKGDLSAAYDRLELARLRKELHDAIQRRHLETLDKAIEHGHESRFKPKVEPLINKAEGVRENLRHLKRIAHAVLEMKQTTIAELRSYKFPPKIIYDILFATFLTLGEKKSNIEDWEDIQILLGKTGRQRVIRRVKEFDTVNLEPDTQFWVEQLLGEYTEDESRLASAGAGTFYVWMRGVIDSLNTAVDTQQNTQ